MWRGVRVPSQEMRSSERIPGHMGKKLVRLQVRRWGPRVIDIGDAC